MSRLQIMIVTALFLALGLLVLLRTVAPAPVRDTAPLGPAQLSRLLAVDQTGSAQRAARADVQESPPVSEEIHEHVAVRVFASGGLYHAPAELGISDRGQQLAIHTHDNTGVVHLHRRRGAAPFTFGQLAAVWGLRLSDGLLAGRAAQAWINGRQVTLRTGVRLTDRADIVIELDGPARRKAAPLRAFDWTAVPLAETA